jgi:CheY-like chemotaxis protein
MTSLLIDDGERLCINEPVVKPAPPPPPKTVLIVDDEDPCRITTSWFLANFGYTVIAARNAEEALALFDPEVHDVVLTDNSMPGISGAEMAHIIKLRSPATLVVMYTGLAPTDQSCLDLVIQRPAHLLTLKEALDKLIAARR